MFENKKIFILGMAKSGYAAAKLLHNYNNEILITDFKEQDEDHVKELESLGIKFVLTDKPEDLLDDSFDYVIKNPGVHPNHIVCIKANKLNIPVTNEVEVAYSLLPNNVKIVGITGSNGKTTTTTITYEIMKRAGLPVVLGGNIGYPVSSLIGNVKEGDTLVLEISSHQLNDIINFKTDISVLTNLSEVHLDHFGTYENYKNQKVKIFNRHTKNDIGILNFDDKDSMEYDNKIPSTKEYFSISSKKDAYIEDGYICYKGEKVIALKDILLKGNHNYENIMCAIMVVKQFNVSNDVINEVLKEFKGVEHRLEYVTTKNGIAFYNDSKATNIKSTQIALSSFNTPTILLLGGLDRGHSFEGLVSYLKNTKLIVCYGQTKERIKEFADNIKMDCIVVETLEEATTAAYNHASSGDTILLSPACASWDQYKKFEDRGEDFKRVINNL
ncbi:MAG: UDP-N-acetylmuramoyl-L-alanine--D-glutamate ligase [Clostridia bacterium]|nr:UDP-N-acetylmuramoyl-L-alanine--D-glutamate ligase [Clostridia bacterium]